MIESEEVFDSTQETGYRLCSSDINSTSSSNYFSATWDANDPDRLFICSQDGLLKVVNSQKNTERHYRIKFKPFSIADTHVTGAEDINDDNQRGRPFTLDSANCNSRPIYAHWDKMITIHDRPDEMIFLLGITKVGLSYQHKHGYISPPHTPNEN